MCLYVHCTAVNDADCALSVSCYGLRGRLVCSYNVCSVCYTSLYMYMYTMLHVYVHHVACTLHLVECSRFTSSGDLLQVLNTTCFRASVSDKVMYIQCPHISYNALQQFPQS